MAKRMTYKILEKKLAVLNRLNGFTKVGYRGRGKKYGAGYILSGAYGGTQVDFQIASGGASKVTHLMTKAQLGESIDNMIESVRIYKDRVKMKKR